MISQYKSIEREKTIVSKMIELYCKRNHKCKDILCEDCEKLRSYSIARLNNCRYTKDKHVCRKCKTPCYSPSMRDQIKKVMRFSGPRMILYHPLHVIYYITKKVIGRINNLQ